MKYTKEQLIEWVNNSKCIWDIISFTDLSKQPGNYTYISRLIQKFQIDISHFEDQRKYQKRISKDLSHFLVEHREIVPNGHDLKQKLYKAKLKEPRCELCGQDENWRGKKMSLILDHINGDRHNNLLTNLRIVCPNCNATLDTHCGRNKNTDKQREINKRIIIKESNQNIFKQLSKTTKDISTENKINRIKNSGIDFTKTGYLLKVGELMQWTPQYSGKFIKKYIPELWENCKTHQNNSLTPY